AEMLQKAAATDDDCLDTGAALPDFGPEVANLAKAPARLGLDHPASERGVRPHRSAPGILSSSGRNRSSPRPRPRSFARFRSFTCAATFSTSSQAIRTVRP